MAHDDYFERKGCYYLAMALIRDSLTQLIADPNLERVETQNELAWLQGKVKFSPVTAAEVFGTLGIGDYCERFAELAAKNPRQVMERIRGLNHVLDEMASTDIANSEAVEHGAEGGAALTHHAGAMEPAPLGWRRERERVC